MAAATAEEVAATPKAAAVRAVAAAAKAAQVRAAVATAAVATAVAATAVAATAVAATAVAATAMAMAMATTSAHAASGVVGRRRGRQRREDPPTRRGRWSEASTIGTVYGPAWCFGRARANLGEGKTPRSSASWRAPTPRATF